MTESTTPSAPSWKLVILLAALAGAGFGALGGLVAGLALVSRRAAPAGESPAGPTGPQAGAPAQSPIEIEPPAASAAEKAPPAGPEQGAPAPLHEAAGRPPTDSSGSTSDFDPLERAAFAVFDLVALDPDGVERPLCVAVLVGEKSVLAPWAAIEGAEAARVVDERRRPWRIAGAVVHEPVIGLALLALEDAPRVDPVPIAAEPITGPFAAWLVPAPSARTQIFHEALLEPGRADRFTGAPRLGVDPPAPAPAALFDAEGRLVGLVDRPGGEAVPASAAAAWAGRTGPAVALPALRRLLGEGSPRSRLERARALLARQRYEEAARLLLDVAAAQPGLSAEILPDLEEALKQAHALASATADAARLLPLTAQATALFPNEGTFWLLRAREHAQGGEVEPALLAFARARDLLPSQARAIETEALSVLEQEARRLAREGLRDAAVSLLLAHLPDFPDAAEPRRLAAELLYLDRKFGAAADLFEEAAHLDPTRAAEDLERARLARDLMAGPGRIVIDHEPGARVLDVVVTIDGRTGGKARIDPDAPRTRLPRDWVEGAGYRLAGMPRVLDGLGPGAPERHVATIRTLDVAGVKVPDVEAIVDDPGAPAVLGADFLGRFRVASDPALGRTVLHPREKR